MPLLLAKKRKNVNKIMQNLLPLLIILIFIFRGLSKLIENARREEKKEEPHPEEWERYFESMGIPPPVEEEKEAPKLPPLLPKVEKKAVEPAPLKTKIKKEELISELPPLKIPSLSLDKVREGIILAEILGPPLAKR